MVILLNENGAFASERGNNRKSKRRKEDRKEGRVLVDWVIFLQTWMTLPTASSTKLNVTHHLLNRVHFGCSTNEILFIR